MSKPYHDKETLERLYLRKGMSTYEIADHFEVTQPTIHKWIQKHEIPTRKSNRDIHGNFTMSTRGYMMFQTKVGDKNKMVKIHRLLAVAAHGFDSVKGKDVHHKNGVKWDNRPSNLQVVDPKEHSRMHYDDRQINDLGQFV